MQVLDINSSRDDLAEIISLKEDFSNSLQNVRGTTIIINNFPSHEIIDYLILINIERIHQNYYRVNYNGKYHYVDNIVLAVKKIKDCEIDNVDRYYLYNKDAILNHVEENKSFNKSLQKYLSKFQNIICCTVFHISTRNKNLSYISPEIIVNQEITAKSLIQSYIYQHIAFRKNSTRINAFPKNNFMDSQTLQELAQTIVASDNDRFKYGILTKKKLDLISSKRSNKHIENIYNSIEGGTNAINIVTGKAGTGKTVFLSRIIHKLVKNGRNARFLTFNRVLVYDMKCLVKSYGNYNFSNFSCNTIHSYFHKLVKEMGIDLILSENRVSELLDICSIRFDKFRPTYNTIKNELYFTKKFLLEDVTSRENDRSNYPEFMEIADYFMGIRDFRNWEAIKNNYINKKKQLLQRFIGARVFLEDYPKALETLYKSIIDTKQFYKEFDIANRYELLSFVYNADIHADDGVIPYRKVEQKVEKIRRSAVWSSIIFIDEAQDCQQYEKEILFVLRGYQNMVVANGGKEQLIRTHAIRLWNMSNKKPIPSNITKLYSTSYRQKSNVIKFVNEVAKEYSIDMKLKSHETGEKVGKVILDLRKNDSLYDISKINDLLGYGMINECSVYESLVLLIPSTYVNSGSDSTSFNVDSTDHVTKTKKLIDKKLKEVDIFTSNKVPIWSGVTEKKSTLRVPYHNQLRIIPYESCRGIEAWSFMCLELDSFIKSKWSSEDAEKYLIDDLFLSEEDRRDKYTIIWLLMAFTRPIDTLYIDLRKRKHDISKRIVDICRELQGIEILE